jgi:hypothetical protein
MGASFNKASIESRPDFSTNVQSWSLISGRQNHHSAMSESRLTHQPVTQTVKAAAEKGWSVGWVVR